MEMENQRERVGEQENEKERQTEGQKGSLLFGLGEGGRERLILMCHTGLLVCMNV